MKKSCSVTLAVAFLATILSYQCLTVETSPLFSIINSTDTFAPLNQQFGFYKLSLHWPLSFCNVKSPPRCSPPTPQNIFSIHGLWPQYANDKPVPPYNPTTNKCVPGTPKTADDITLQLLNPVILDMEQSWPNLQDQSKQGNLRFWRYEWSKHGMCTEYYNKPLGYFQKALSITIENDLPRTIRSGLTRGTTYRAENISSIVKKNLGKLAEISCNQDYQGTVQLFEVRICLDRNTYAFRDCPTPFSGTCRQSSTNVLFP